MKISLVCPNRNNLKYFKWMYDSVQKNKGNHEVFICSAADACTDGTVEYYNELAQQDDHFKFIVNEGPQRIGLTVLYNRIVNELVETDIAMIWHCDMYLAPGALDAIEKYLFTAVHTDHVPGGWDLVPNQNTIVSLTRIEPPLHPPGAEKLLLDCGIEPEDFDEDKFLQFVHNELDSRTSPGGITEGVFAPWAFWVDQFKQIGGHDPIFSPGSKEDSDIFNRFILNGTQFIQTWEGFVYHMTCRGSRFNPTITQVGINSDEWNEQNIRSSRNFIRKWGHFVKHDQYLKPIVPARYHTTFIINGPMNETLLNYFEPWADSLIYQDPGGLITSNYADSEGKHSGRDKWYFLDKLTPISQPKTAEDVEQLLEQSDVDTANLDVIVVFNTSNLTQSDLDYLNNIPYIVQQDDVQADQWYAVGNLSIKAVRKTDLNQTLIHIN